MSFKCCKVNIQKILPLSNEPLLLMAALYNSHYNQNSFSLLLYRLNTFLLITNKLIDGSSLQCKIHLLNLQKLKIKFSLLNPKVPIVFRIVKLV